VKTIHVAKDLAMFCLAVSLCGGADHVRYGLGRPTTAFVRELELAPGKDDVLLFARLPGDAWISIRVQWHEALWSVLAANGLQPADMPVDTWAKSAWLRVVNLSPDPVLGPTAIARILASIPDSFTETQNGDDHDGR
jgi:hypothetical protein